MQRFYGAFISLGVVMLFGFMLVILEKGHGLFQLIGILLMFGAVFAAPAFDLRDKDATETNK